MIKLTKCNQKGIKNKGFTLIELLAVIVILAVIALIATPIVLSILTKVRKSAFQDSAYGMMESAKAEYSEAILDGENVPTFFEYPFDNLKFTGMKPKGGMISIDKNGNIAIAIHNNEWCASKGFLEREVTLTEYKEETCIIRESENDPMIILNGNQTLYIDLNETYTELGAKASTRGGEELDYKTEIKKNGEIVSSIDTSKETTYQIKYEASNNGKIVSIERTIVVLDMTPMIKMSEENETYVKEKDVLLNVSGIRPNEVENFTYEIKKDEESTKIETVNGLTKTLTLNETGIYEVIVTVKDNNNHSNTLSKIYKIDATKPTYTVKSTAAVTVSKGASNIITNYFNNPVWSISGTGTVVCKNGNTVITNTSSLNIGTYTITCTATGVTNLSTSANKTIIVKPKEQTGLEVITNNDVGLNGTIRTDNYGNKRYAGSNPNNWVCFGTQDEQCSVKYLYRIIGIFDGSMKIIKYSYYANHLRFDTTGGTYGSNNWDRPADLKTEFNTNFYNNTDYIDEISRSYVAEGIWYIGTQKDYITDLGHFEDGERSVTSTGYIGLMSVTDFGYASNNVDCERTTKMGANDRDNKCTYNNYLFRENEHQWTITPNGTDSKNVWYVVKTRYLDFCGAYATINQAYPSLFLKPEVKIISGKGTQSDPYRLSM